MSKKKSKKKKVRVEPLLFAGANGDADMKYFSRFDCGDPFLAFGKKGERFGVANALEYNRMIEESCFDGVIDWDGAMKKAKKAFGLKKKQKGSLVDLICYLQKKNKIAGWRVPRNFPAWLLVAMKERKVHVEVAEGAMFLDREIKTEAEIECLREANAAAAAGHAAARRVLRESTIGKDGVLRWKRKVLTSEILRVQIDAGCLAKGALNVHPAIAAGGDQGVDCHCNGFGPLRANELIVVDIFPRVGTTGYFGDMTRTYLKGTASPEQKALYNAVRKAQRLALTEIKAGVDSQKPWKTVVKFFKDAGYKTVSEKGTYEGFFHGLGHGLGLDVHEAPNMGRRKGKKLKAGQVVTVEPGLYYKGLGGVRIEDVVVVTEDGNEMISKAPYTLEIA